jgi:hypothetical protein
MMMGGSAGAPWNDHCLKQTSIIQKAIVFFLLTFEYEKIFYKNPYMMEKVYEAGKRYKA